MRTNGTGGIGKLRRDEETRKGGIGEGRKRQGKEGMGKMEKARDETRENMIGGS